MHVGKPRRDVPPLGVDLQLTAATNFTDGDNPVSRDRDVPDDTWTPGAIKNCRAADHNVVLWGARDGAA